MMIVKWCRARKASRPDRLRSAIRGAGWYARGTGVVAAREINGMRHGECAGSSRQQRSRAASCNYLDIDRHDNCRLLPHGDESIKNHNDSRSGIDDVQAGKHWPFTGHARCDDQKAMSSIP